MEQKLSDINKVIVNFSNEFSKFRKCNTTNKDVCINLHRLVAEIHEYLNDDNLMDFETEFAIPNSDSDNDEQMNILRKGRSRRRQLIHHSNRSSLISETYISANDLTSTSDDNRLTSNGVWLRREEDESDKIQSESSEDEFSDTDSDSRYDSLRSDRSTFNDTGFTELSFKETYYKFLKEQFIEIQRNKLFSICKLCQCNIFGVIEQRYLKTENHSTNASKMQQSSSRSSECNNDETSISSRRHNNDSMYYIKNFLHYYYSLPEIGFENTFCVKDNIKHILSETHQKNFNLLTYELCEIKIPNMKENWNDDGISDEKLLHDHKISSSYYCKVCHFGSERKRSIFSHIASESHLDKLSFVKKYRLSLLTSEQKLQFLKYEKIFHDNNIIKRTDKCSFCRLCQILIPEFDIEEHRNDRNHITAFKKKNPLISISEENITENFEFMYIFTNFCELCEEELGYLNENCDEHIQSRRHTRNLSKHKHNNQSNISEVNESNESQSSLSYRSIISGLQRDFITMVQDKENIKLFLNKKIQNSNKLKDLVEYKAIIAVLENSLNRIFPATKIYLFGPRLFGLGCFHPTQDIFIDTGFNYLQWPIDSNVSIQNKIQQIIHHLKQYFHSSWSNLRIVFNNEPELYGKFADHTCDYRMTFTNGMDHARTTLLHYYFQQQPICQTLCTFLIQITIESHLDKILNTDIVCSLVVFYLQLHKYLPPVKQLLVLNKPPIARIGPWQINYITCTTNTKFHDIFPKITDERRIFEIMKDFLVFYSNLFDYNNVIMSPFLGQVLQRSDFEKSVPTILPELHDLYLKCPFKIKLNIDSALCIQDFIELNSNVGQKVKQKDLNKFIDCIEEVLENIEW